MSDACTIPKMVPGGHLPVCVEIDLQAASEMGLFWGFPEALYSSSSFQKAYCTQDFLDKEEKIHSDLISPCLPPFQRSLRFLDTQKAWNLPEKLAGDRLKHQTGGPPGSFPWETKTQRPSLQKQTNMRP